MTEANNTELRERYDVAILGGGLAGLTLALQLKPARPEDVDRGCDAEGPRAGGRLQGRRVDRRGSPHYFGDVLGLRDHIEKEQLHKCGLRFFFPAGDNTDITKRVECGARFDPPVPSLPARPRALRERARRRCVAAGVDLLDGCTRPGRGARRRRARRHAHRGTERRRRVGRAGSSTATGRACILKRKLGLREDIGHDVNSAWFRLGAAGSTSRNGRRDDASGWGGWRAGLRKFSTNHLCGEGYWVWLIPLASGPISIGIVADPRFHPLERINTLDERARLAARARAAARGARRRPPRRGRGLPQDRELLLRLQAGLLAERWCLAGEAGAFLDPFYSPGSDFIAMSQHVHHATSSCATSRARTSRERAEAHNDFFLPHLRAFLVHVRGPVRVLGQPAGDDREDQRQQHLLLVDGRRCCSSTASSPTSSSWRRSGPTSSASGG